jgi:Uma2 family endonuclease
MNNDRYIRELLEGENIIAENITFAEYSRDFNDQRVEWILGFVIQIPSKTIYHQRILGTLLTLMGLFVGSHKLGEMMLGPFTMYVGDDKPAREPDLLFIAEERRHLFGYNYFAGAADLVIEIVDPESIRRDRILKLREYEAAGVREYWIIDHLTSEFLVHVPNENGRFQLLPHSAEGKIVSSVIPGFNIHPDILWHEELSEGENLLAMIQAMLK